MVKVVCLNWRDYLGMGDRYVANLRGMVRRNLTLPYEFLCVTERDVPDGRTGWWNKLSLLELFDGEVLFFDLDVVITQNIDCLVEAGRIDPGRLWARDDFSYSRVNPKRGLDRDFLRTLGGPGTINSSVMYWRGRRHIEPLAGAHGDQNAITAALWPDGIGLFGNDVIHSYKYHPGALAPVVVFHGEPKPHQVGDAWVRDHWQ